jgi:hypothetical protein
VDTHVELTLVSVHAKGSPMQTDDITNLVTDRKVFESLSVDDNS